MSAHLEQKKRIGVPDIRARKGGVPLVCLTAYTAPMAGMLDAHADLLLVGDSLGMVVYGMDSTLPVDLDTMIRHGQAVVRGAEKTCVIVDMPFGSYQESPEQAFRNCARVLKETGCSGVKLEGGAEMTETIRFLSARGIPVMGHVGLMPQHVKTAGGYKVQGRENAQAQIIMEDAKAVANAGAFSIVIEGVAEPLAAAITGAVDIPTIGIGASAACDGQILVSEDMLGLTPGHKAKFVKAYANLAKEIGKAAETYADDVRARRFPDADHVYGSPAPVPRKRA